MKERIKERVMAGFLAITAGGFLFAEESEAAKSQVKLGVSLDAVAAVQVVNYNHTAANGDEPLADPLITGGFGNEDGNRSKLNLNFTGSYNGIAGLYADVSLYPWWQDNRDQDLLINVGSIELGQTGGWLNPLPFLTVNAGRFEL